MSLLDQVTPSPRKIMTLFYVVDTSGSMTGDKIGSVNSAMEEAITVDLPDISTANDDAEMANMTDVAKSDLVKLIKELHESAFSHKTRHAKPTPPQTFVLTNVNQT